MDIKYVTSDAISDIIYDLSVLCLMLQSSVQMCAGVYDRKLSVTIRRLMSGSGGCALGCSWGRGCENYQERSMLVKFGMV